ncbi:hypothetical protein D3C76_660770 [compost metagenome]
MLEQQGHHVVQLFDSLDALGVRQFLQHRDTVAHFAETPFQPGQLQRIDLFGRHLLPVLQAMPDQGRRIAQQQIDLFFYCSCHGTVSGDSRGRALAVDA